MLEYLLSLVRNLSVEHDTVKELVLLLLFYALMDIWKQKKKKESMDNLYVHVVLSVSIPPLSFTLISFVMWQDKQLRQESKAWGTESGVVEPFDGSTVYYSRKS